MDAQLDTFSLTILITTLTIGVLTLLALGTIYLFRVRKIDLVNRLRQLEIEAERKIFENELSIKELTLSSVARELHDNVGYGLTLIKLRLFQIDGISNLKTKNEIDACLEEISYILDEVRSISRRLSSDYIIENGLVNSILNDIKKLNKIQQIKFELKCQIEETGISPKSEIVIYRILQESINNVIKHSNATTCTIFINDSEKNIEITILDNGIGMPEGFENIKNKNGILNIQKSTEVISGKVEFENFNPGFKTILYIPKSVNNEIQSSSSR